jgi:DNA modification methylase
VIDNVWLFNGDCVKVMQSWPEASVDAVVCDPPYEIGFMKREWDQAGVAFACATWEQVLRVLKPGGHLLAFGGTRTYHRMACAIEDAGFEIRDSIHWIYGSGFPKSLDVSKAIDKATGARGHERKNTRVDGGVGTASYRPTIDPREYERPDPITEAAKAWNGWGTALKPAHEPIVLARKPLIGTVAENVLAYGTGGLNIDGCRIGRAPSDPPSGWSVTGSHEGENRAMAGKNYERAPKPDASGRWPANVMFDEAAAAELDAQSGISKSGIAVQRNGGGQKIGGNVAYAGSAGLTRPDVGYGDTGGASRFFYVAKPSRRERDHGLESFPVKSRAEMTDREEGSTGASHPRAGAGSRDGARNPHPTVKPVALMRELCRLITPPHGVVLDPFVGSGTTGMAARLEGFKFIGIDQSAEYLNVAYHRIAAAHTLL